MAILMHSSSDSALICSFSVGMSSGAVIVNGVVSIIISSGINFGALDSMLSSMVVIGAISLSRSRALSI